MHETFHGINDSPARETGIWQRGALAQSRPSRAGKEFHMRSTFGLSSRTRAATCAATLLVLVLALPLGACSDAAARPSSSAALRANQNREVVVYVTRTGEKYHRGSCRHLAKSKIPMTLEDARRSYAPCKVCRPPQ
jgi:hypothetical protein